jgi:hypothetical protein
MTDIFKKLWVHSPLLDYTMVLITAIGDQIDVRTARGGQVLTRQDPPFSLQRQEDDALQCIFDVIIENLIVKKDVQVNQEVQAEKNRRKRRKRAKKGAKKETQATTTEPFADRLLAAIKSFELHQHGINTVMIGPAPTKKIANHPGFDSGTKVVSKTIPISPHCIGLL